MDPATSANSVAANPSCVLGSTPLIGGLVTDPVLGWSARPTDLLRLVAIPVFGWAAYRDVKTRRVPNRTWYPIAALAFVLLIWDGYVAFQADDRLFFLQVALSLGFIIPLVTAFYYMGSFGGADAKAFYVLAVLFPAYPVYYLPSVALPLHPTPVGVFSLTILSNTVVAGVLYPVGLAVSNLLRGNLGLLMAIGRPIAADRLPEEYGIMLETPSGVTRRGLDLDALRMYLRWRGCSLADLRADPDQFRDPASLPAETNPPTDGNVVTDGGHEEAGPTPSGESVRETVPADETIPRFESPGAADDPWGAAAFLDDIETGAYGTTPETLRDGLDVVVSEDEVWISPGIPFIVPMFVGLLISLLYGDVLVMALTASGIA